MTDVSAQIDETVIRSMLYFPSHTVPGAADEHVTDERFLFVIPGTLYGCFHELAEMALARQECGGDTVFDCVRGVLRGW